MKVETWVFGVNAVFFGVITPVYWYLSEDWAGTSALTMTTALALLVTIYLGVTAKNMDDRPEDRQEGEIAEGAGEVDFFPPYSWWPLFSALALAVCVLGVVIGWWLFIIGVGLGSITVCGFVFEYYRGEHAH